MRSLRSSLKSDGYSVNMWVKRDILILKITHAAWQTTWNSSKRILIGSARSAKRYVVNSFVFLTFICPCISSISLKYNRQDATFSLSIYSYKLLYMFQAVFSPIIRSTKLYLQRQVLSNQYCCLLQQGAVLVWQYLTLYVEFCAPDDGWRNCLKHVEQFIWINRERKRCILLVVL